MSVTLINIFEMPAATKTNHRRLGKEPGLPHDAAGTEIEPHFISRCTTHGSGS